jgi:SAM-dependent methyltransferase
VDLDMSAPYDEIADWYEDEFLSDRSEDGLPMSDPIGVDGSLCEMLGEGAGASLEVGCGTGTHAARVRRLGWSPLGIDLSAGMLQHGRNRLLIAQADGGCLPFGDASFASVIAVMIHTDVSDYLALLKEAWRVLAPVAASSTSGFTRASAADLPIELTLKPSLSAPATSIATGRRHRGRTGAFGTRLEQRTCRCLLCSARSSKLDLCLRDSMKAGSRSPRCWP